MEYSQHSVVPRYIGLQSDDEDFAEIFKDPRTQGSTKLVHLQHPSMWRQFSYNSDSDKEEGCFTDVMRRGSLPYDDYDEMGLGPDPCVGDQLRQGLRQGSIVDGLLLEIYDSWNLNRRDSIDSDDMTEASSTSEFFVRGGSDVEDRASGTERRHSGQLNRAFLQNQSETQLKRMLFDLQRSVAVMNIRLVRQLKRRDSRQAKLQRNCDIVTAVLQAASLKRQIDTRMKFSIQPPPGGSAHDQWADAMKAVCRLPLGIPADFRRKVWLSLADHYMFQLKINWEKTVRFVFNERSNPDDDKLGMQIVKDLHRTGCSSFSGEDNDSDRAVLKRLLLAYARWNKRVGYCQGFNVIAALLLNVMDRKEDDALKVMIYLIDSVLPESYFANNLRALSVDMAVFRDLLRLTYPRLSKHLDDLQKASQDMSTGACYEPPLTNVFTMQWFLTLFATCLPVDIVLRVWDTILLEGSEILLRAALTIWGKLAKRIMEVGSADEFYCLMGELSQHMMMGELLDGDTMVKCIYALGDFPLSHLHELREKYTYDIRPFTPAESHAEGTDDKKKKDKASGKFKPLFNSDDDDMDDDDITAMASMPGDSPPTNLSDISVLGPGVYSTNDDAEKDVRPQLERMSTDIGHLKLQYSKLKQRQQQAHIIIAAASAKQPQRGRKGPPMPPSIVPDIESPTAMNHLFIGKSSNRSKNKMVAEAPRISAPAASEQRSGLLVKQLQAVANAKAVSKCRRMRTGVPKRGESSKSIKEEDEDGSSNTAETPTVPKSLDLIEDVLNGDSKPDENKSPGSAARSFMRQNSRDSTAEDKKSPSGRPRLFRGQSQDVLSSDEDENQSSTKPSFKDRKNKDSDASDNRYLKEPESNLQHSSSCETVLEEPGVTRSKLTSRSRSSSLNSSSSKTSDIATDASGTVSYVRETSSEMSSHNSEFSLNNDSLDMDYDPAHLALQSPPLDAKQCQRQSLMLAANLSLQSPPLEDGITLEVRSERSRSMIEPKVNSTADRRISVPNIAIISAQSLSGIIKSSSSIIPNTVKSKSSEFIDLPPSRVRSKSLIEFKKDKEDKECREPLVKRTISMPNLATSSVDLLSTNELSVDDTETASVASDTTCVEGYVSDGLSSGAFDYGSEAEFDHDQGLINDSMDTTIMNDSQDVTIVNDSMNTANNNDESRGTTVNVQNKNKELINNNQDIGCEKDVDVNKNNEDESFDDAAKLGVETYEINHNTIKLSINESAQSIVSSNTDIDPDSSVFDSPTNVNDIPVKEEHDLGCAAEDSKAELHLEELERLSLKQKVQDISKWVTEAETVLESSSKKKDSLHRTSSVEQDTKSQKHKRRVKSHGHKDRSRSRETKPIDDSDSSDVRADEIKERRKPKSRHAKTSENKEDEPKEGGEPSEDPKDNTDIFYRCEEPVAKPKFFGSRSVSMIEVTGNAPSLVPTIMEEEDSDTPRKGSQPIVRKVGGKTIVVATKPAEGASPTLNLDRRASSPHAVSPWARRDSNAPGLPSLAKKSSKPFNPFPVNHFNPSRAKAGIKLGLYKPATIDKFRKFKPPGTPTS